MMNTDVGVIEPVKYKSVKRANRIGLIVSYMVLAILTIVWLYPILWIVLNAFRVEYNSSGGLIGIVVSYYFPHHFGLENFKLLLAAKEGVVDPILGHTSYFLIWFKNTLFVAVFTMILSTLITLAVAYVMSKLHFKFRKPYLNLAIILGLFPGFMSMIAIYYILKAFQLTHTLYALILVYSAGAGLGFYIAKGFFDIIPNSLIESAKLDGATNSRIFRSIILPMSRPIIIYTALLSFTGPWMDFIFANVILGPNNTLMHTVAVGLYNMMYAAQSDVSVFTQFAAGCVIVAVPIVTLFILMQRYYIEGVTAGAVKG